MNDPSNTFPAASQPSTTDDNNHGDDEVVVNNSSSTTLFPTFPPSLSSTINNTSSLLINNNNSLFSFQPLQSNPPIPSSSFFNTSSNNNSSSSFFHHNDNNSNKTNFFSSSTFEIKNNNNTQLRAATKEEQHQQHVITSPLSPISLRLTSASNNNNNNCTGINNNMNINNNESTERSLTIFKALNNNNNNTNNNFNHINNNNINNKEARSSSERIGRQNVNNIFSSPSHANSNNIHNNNTSPLFSLQSNSNNREMEIDTSGLLDSERVSFSISTSTTSNPINSLPIPYQTGVADSTLHIATESSYSENSHNLLNNSYDNINPSEEVIRKTRHQIETVENWVRRASFYYLVKGLSIGLLIFLFLSLFVAVLVGLATFALEEMRTKSIRETAKYNCFMADSAIKKRIEVTITALDNIRETVISWDYNVDPDKFDEFAMKTSQYQYFNIIHTFGMTRNYTLTEVYPMNVLKSLVGQEIGIEPNHREQLQIAIETNSTTIYGPFLTINNQYSLMAQQPILDFNLNFWGFSLVVLEFGEIFQQVNLTSLLENYSIRFYDNKQGMVFYQRLLSEHKNYDLNNLENAQFIYEAINITIIDTTWEMLLIPIDYHDSSVLTLEILIPIIIVVFGLLAILISSISFSRYTLRVRADKETLEIFASTDETLKKEIVEFVENTLKKVENYVKEENNLIECINSLDPLVTLFIDESALINTVNRPFLTLFGYNDESELENVDLQQILPLFDITDVYKTHEKTPAQDREYILHFPYVEGCKKFGARIKLSLSLTFSNTSITEPVFCTILLKPSESLLNNIPIDEEITENTSKFMKTIIENKSNMMSFIDFLKKKRRQDDRNIIFIQNVKAYKVMKNIQERNSYMEEIITDCIICKPNERLYDVSPEAFDSFHKKVRESSEDKSGVFDALVVIVIQNFFLLNVFDSWQKERTRKEAPLKNLFDPILKSKTKLSNIN